MRTERDATRLFCAQKNVALAHLLIYMSEANRLDHNAAVVALSDTPRQHRRGDAKHHVTTLATINEQVLEKQRDDLVRRNEPSCTIDCSHPDAVSIVYQPSIGPHLDHGLFAVVDPRLDGSGCMSSAPSSISAWISTTLMPKAPMTAGR